ncbi:NRP2-like protein [Mya arenaria]|uniref:NRP2-like protein n=1 Tax=Mya arenaria TaxID=6604 RepID=A0ABY7G1D2_MYAAR|nr:NRP2-like protein [Mya arenaria]
MTASSYLDPNTPSSGRLITGIGWKPSVRGEPFCGSEWLQVDFGSDTYVTGFKLQSSNDDAQDVVSSFTVKYSLNGYAWYDITEMDGVTPKKERFSARYIRVVSTDVRCTVGLRLEVLGVKSTTSAYDCSSVTSNTSPLPEQSYVVNTDTGTILVCGASEVEYLTSISFPYADYRGETDNEMYAVYGTDGDGFKLTGTLEGMQ